MRREKNSLTQNAQIICTAFVIMFFPSVLFADGDLPPELNADCSVEIMGEPRLGEPFEAVFTFTPNQDLIHTKGIPDTARILMNDEIEYLRGDTIWTGFLEKGKTYVLRAYLLVSDSIRFRITGKVIAMQAMGLFMSVRDIPDPGVKARNGTSSRIIDFTGRPENVVILNVYEFDAVDSSIKIVGKDTIPRSKFGPPPIPIIHNIPTSDSGHIHYDN